MDTDDTYYVSTGDRRIGPVTFEQIAAALRGGKLGPDADVCRVGDASWTRLDQHPHFASLVAPAAAIERTVVVPSTSTPRAAVAETVVEAVPQPTSAALPTTSGSAPVTDAPSVAASIVIGVVGLALGTLSAAMVALYIVMFDLPRPGWRAFTITLYCTPAGLLGLASGALLGMVLAAPLGRLPADKVRLVLTGIALVPVALPGVTFCMLCALAAGLAVARPRPSAASTPSVASGPAAPVAVAPPSGRIVGCWATDPNNIASPSEAYRPDGSYVRLSILGRTTGRYIAPTDSELTLTIGGRVISYRTTFIGDSVTFAQAGTSETYTRIPCGDGIPAPAPHRPATVPPSVASAPPASTGVPAVGCLWRIRDPEPPTHIRPAPHDTSSSLGEPANGTEIHIVSRSGRWVQIDQPVAGWVFDQNIACE